MKIKTRRIVSENSNRVRGVLVNTKGKNVNSKTQHVTSVAKKAILQLCVCRKLKMKAKHNSGMIGTIFDISDGGNIEQLKSFIGVEISGHKIAFQMDSGASISAINLKTYEQLNKPSLKKTDRILYVFGRKKIPVLGELHTTIKCGNWEKV